MPKVIDLEKPLIGHSGPVKRITLRDPEFRDLITVGTEPEQVVYTGSGTAFFVQENVDAIAKYAALLVVENDAAALLETLSLRDAGKVRRAVIDFFREASGSAPSPTSSSSPSASTPTPSAG